MAVRVEVTDRYGTVAELADPGILQALHPGQRDQLGKLAGGLIRDLARILGSDEDHARQLAVAELTRMMADESAYERVAERRGLLAL